MNFTLKLNRLYHYIFGEKFYKKLEFEWHKYPDRCQIIKETILRKNCLAAGVIFIKDH